MSFWGELRRRNVFKVAVAYAIVAWLLVQVASILLPTFDAPRWVLQVFVLFVILGFPVAVVLAWAFELTPQGIRPAGEVPRSESATGLAGQRFNYAIVTLLALAVTVLIIDRYVLGEHSAAVPVAQNGAAAVKPAQVTIGVPDGSYLAVDSEHPVLALSPDGSRIVFVGEANGQRRLYLREIAAAEARPIPGTEDAAGPIFSPGGDWIGFVAGGLFKKVAVDGGVPVVVRPVTDPSVAHGATWTSRDRIVFAASTNSGLEIFSVDADPDQPFEYLTAGTEHYSWPHSLPGGTDVLFTDNTAGSIADAIVSIISIDTGEIASLVPGASSPRYSPTGHILYARDAAIWAVPFDAATGDVEGPEAHLIDGVMQSVNGAAHFDVAGDGTLAYVAASGARSTHELAWVDREGNIETLVDVDRRFADPRLSPDGTQLALMSPTGANLDIWMLDLMRDNTLTRWTTHPGEDFGPVWSPDGRRLALSSEIGEDFGELGPGLAWASGPGQAPERLLETPGDGNWDFATSWSPDGRWILFSGSRNRTTSDLYRFDTHSGEAEAYVETPFFETGARLSPNGEWVAYVSDRSGRREIYIEPFPGPGDLLQISQNGGSEPVWAPDGTELFYREGDKLMAVALGGDETLDPSPPQVLFEGSFVRSSFGGGNASYDVSPDGGRFVMIKEDRAPSPTVIHLVFNWQEVLETPAARSAQ